MATLISVPAGRCIRRGETKWVDPQPEKGLLQMRYEDDLMHLYLIVCRRATDASGWRSRETRLNDDELIIFPGEATFEKVRQVQDPTGRTHILRFSSSDQRYFKVDASTDVRAQVDINALLQNPSYRPGTAPLPREAPITPYTAQGESSTSSADTERSWPPTPGAPRLTHPEPLPASSSSRGQVSNDMQIDPPLQPLASAGPTLDPGTQREMARLLMHWAQAGGLGGSGSGITDNDVRLTEVLSPANITALVQADPTLPGKLRPLLPDALGLEENPSAETIIPILTAPQLTDAISSLENALRSGGLPESMMVELGLPESAGQSVGDFVAALRGLKKDDKMETDE